MRIFKSGLIYFSIVFSAGFALALVRLPFLVPRFGARTSELMETPLMLAVVIWASRRLAHSLPELTRSHRLVAGLTALLLMVSAEFAIAYFLGARSPSQYIASRDPISGSVYLASLVFFAVAPALWQHGAGPNNSFKPNTLRSIKHGRKSLPCLPPLRVSA